MSMAWVDPDTRMQAPRHRVDQTRSICDHGRGVFDEDCDRQDLHAVEGLDARKRIQPIISYGFPKNARLTPGWRPAARVAAFRAAVFRGAIALQAANTTAQIRRF